MQYNKRDLKNILTVEELNARLNPEGRFDCFESVAVDGTGVFETLKAITKLTLRSLRRRMAAQEGAAAPGTRHPRRRRCPPRSTGRVQPRGTHRRCRRGVGHTGVGRDACPSPRATCAAGQDGAGTTVKAPPVATRVRRPSRALAERQAAPPAAEETTAELPPAEEVEEGPVEFATTPEPVTEAVETEMRHVKVSSSLDILAELETLRKSSTFRPEPRPARDGAPSLDIDDAAPGLAELSSGGEAARRGEGRQRARDARPAVWSTSSSSTRTGTRSRKSPQSRSSSSAGSGCASWRSRSS